MVLQPSRGWHAMIHLGQVSAGPAVRTLIRLEHGVCPWLGGLLVAEIEGPQLLQTGASRFAGQLRSTRCAD